MRHSCTAKLSYAWFICGYALKVLSPSYEIKKKEEEKREKRARENLGETSLDDGGQKNSSDTRTHGARYVHTRNNTPRFYIYRRAEAAQTGGIKSHYDTISRNATTRESIGAV